MTAIARWGNDLAGAEKYGVPQPALGDLGESMTKGDELWEVRNATRV